MLLVIFLTGAILWNLPLSKYVNVCASHVEPGYLDFDNLPDTNFSCEGKVIGGYYADIETGCQMFHVCTIGQKSEITDIKFLCLNGTVFDQETRVCERLDEVDCSKSESFFDLNLELYGNNGGGYGIQSEDDNRDSVADQNCEEDYEDGENTCKTKSDKDSKPKDEEYSDWEEPTTTPVPPPRVSSTTVLTSTLKPTLDTSTRSSLNTKFNYQPLKDVKSPLTTQNPSLQLLALHESFQENLKNRDLQKLRPSSTISSKMPPLPAVSTYQLQNQVHVKPSPFAPLPNKLPNTVSNLSQKTHFPTPLANANRTPSPPKPVTYKSEPQQSNYYPKQHSQKVTLKPPLLPSTPAKHPAVDTSIIYRYNILNTNGAQGADPFSSSVRYSLQPNPPTTPSQTFKVESFNINPLSHPSFTVAQTRPYPFHPKAQHFIRVEDTLSEPEEEDEEFEEVNEEAVLPVKQSQLQPKFDNFNPHTNFARAIPDLKNSSNAAVSVVQSTSSVSSSISSKPHSAISNSSITALSSMPVKNSLISANNKAGANSFASTLLHTSTRLNMNPANITEINEQLTEDQLNYEEASADYEDSSPEYKDIMYPADVQKIKQR